MQYSAKFKEKMVAKMLGPGARSATALAKEVGVAQATLSRWLLQAKMGPMSEKPTKVPNKRWSPSEKIRVVMAAEAAGDAGLGELLRREGLHEETLKQFRDEVLDAAKRGLESVRPARGQTPEQRKVEKLKRELARKEKALAEAAALLVLRKKAEALFRSEEEGDDTDENSD